MQLAEENFLSSWKRLTKDQDILSLVEVYKIPFITAPNQEIIRQNIHMIPAQEKQGDKEISEKPKKGAILLVQENQKKWFLSNVFLVWKRWELSANCQLERIEETYSLSTI